MSELPQIMPGLNGVAVAETDLSCVDESSLSICGYSIEDLTTFACFEEVVHLLWHKHLPTMDELDQLSRSLSSCRSISSATLDILHFALSQGANTMEALQLAIHTLAWKNGDETVDEAISFEMRLVARLPTVIAAFWRLRLNLEPIAPNTALGHADNFLYMLTGEEPAAYRGRAIETYMISLMDLGLNASTLTVRIIASTGSSLDLAVLGGMAALQGPKHGGAAGRAAEFVNDVGREKCLRDTLRDRLRQGEKLPGFGHRVFKQKDPRVTILKREAGKVIAAASDSRLALLYEMYERVEREAHASFEEMGTARRIVTNVDFAAALLLSSLNLDKELFVPMFTLGRIVGWIAHYREEWERGRIYHPVARYTGQNDLPFVPVELRRLSNSDEMNSRLKVHASPALASGELR